MGSIPPWSPVLAILPAAFAVGCGSSGNQYNLAVGTDDGRPGFFGDATGPGARAPLTVPTRLTCRSYPWTTVHTAARAGNECRRWRAARLLPCSSWNGHHNDGHDARRHRCFRRACPRRGRMRRGVQHEQLCDRRRRRRGGGCDASRRERLAECRFGVVQPPDLRRLLRCEGHLLERRGRQRLRSGGRSVRGLHALGVPVRRRRVQRRRLRLISGRIAVGGTRMRDRVVSSMCDRRPLLLGRRGVCVQHR